LETLLRYLGANELIISGIAGNYCVLFTANDAYMRDYRLAVPSDCTISNSAKENRDALELMSKYLGADIRPSSKLRLRSSGKNATAGGRKPTRRVSSSAE
jgi:nicotinamidase-related amidase